MIEFIKEVAPRGAAHNVCWLEYFYDGSDKGFISFPSYHGTLNVLKNVSDEPLCQMHFLLT